jgi:hypothetical protein
MLMHCEGGPIQGRLAGGASIDDLVTDYPDLDCDDVLATLEYVACDSVGECVDAAARTMDRDHFGGLPVRGPKGSKHGLSSGPATLFDRAFGASFSRCAFGTSTLG